MIVATMITTIILEILLGIYLIVISAFVAGALILLMALVISWIWFSWRVRIVQFDSCSHSQQLF